MGDESKLRRTCCCDIAWSKATLIPRYIVFIDFVEGGHLNNVRNDRIVCNGNSLQVLRLNI